MKYKRMPLDVRISNFVDASIECGFAGRGDLTRQDIVTVCENSGIVFPRWLAYNQGVDGGRMIGRAKFSFPELAEAGTGTIEQVEPTSEIVEDATEVQQEQVSIPVMTSNSIPTISAEDMLALSSL